MQEQSFDQLAEEAAAGLKADRELFLDVKQELCSHLEEKASSFTRQGHSADESAELAKKWFGSPLDMAAELLSANRGKMKLRSLLRITFAALIVPLAILCALYVGYGRFARVHAATSFFSYLSGEQNNYHAVKMPTLPFFGISEDPTVKASSVTQLPHGNFVNAPKIRQYWEDHREEPDGRMFYAYYATFYMLDDEQAYVSAMRQGEQIEPQNALYNIFLAEYYLQRGISAKSDKGDQKTATDEMLDRRAFELGITELQKAAAKPYLHDYQMQVLRKRLNALPRPLLTEDYSQQVSVVASTLFPHLSRYRSLARKIPGCARILAAEGRTADAEAVMDSWKPFSVMLTRDSDSVLIKGLLARSCGVMLSKEGVDVYTTLGAKKKAEEARTISERLARMDEERQGRRSKRELQSSSQDDMIQQHGPWTAYLLYPVFAGIEAGKLSQQELTPGRMHEHVLAEQIAVGVTLTLLALSLLGALLQGALWLYRQRRTEAIPLLLMPTTKTITRAMLFGIVVPMLLYWLYSRMPVIGGREFGWASSMAPRFIVELLLLAGVMIWLPAHLIRRNIRQRCDDLGIAMPEQREEGVAGRIVRSAFLAACVLVAVALFTPTETSPWLRATGGALAVGISIASMRYAGKKREQYGFYYGTLARSLAPVYAFSIILLSLTAQPWLLYNEVQWLRKDTVMYGYLTDRNSETAGFTLVETRAAQRFSKLLLEALDAEK